MDSASQHKRGTKRKADSLLPGTEKTSAEQDGNEASRQESALTKLMRGGTRATLQEAQEAYKDIACLWRETTCRLSAKKLMMISHCLCAGGITLKCTKVARWFFLQCGTLYLPKDRDLHDDTEAKEVAEKAAYWAELYHDTEWQSESTKQSLDDDSNVAHKCPTVFGILDNSLDGKTRAVGELNADHQDTIARFVAAQEVGTSPLSIEVKQMYGEFSRQLGLAADIFALLAKTE